MTLEQLETCIVNWAHIRGIAAPDNSRNQLLKTVEELGELSRATLKSDKAGIKDGIGDVLVTLIIFAHTQELDINTCLDAAWQEIKDRTGVTLNGTFIKNG